MRNSFSLSRLLIAITAVAASAALTACSNIAKMSDLPDKENVKVSREDADKDCKELGKVEGRSISTKPTNEEVLKDLRQEAANKGANYVKVSQYSGTAGSVTGEAYLCP
jgi:hypothetical protein